MTEPYVILVAEDEVLVRNLINVVLVRAGYSVLIASDGEEALELSRRYAAEIHLLLSDVTMPRMDGFTLTKLLREERPSTKALLISGKLSSEILEGNAKFDFLRKPFVPDQLKSKIRDILARATGGHSPAEVEQI
jgi:two-component system cell cycle sensor histidine kinase/response regulator CckA